MVPLLLDLSLGLLILLVVQVPDIKYKFGLNSCVSQAHLYLPLAV
jgi:hypothetical protein